MNFQYGGQRKKTASANPINTLLVFLDLLVCSTKLPGNVLQSQIGYLPRFANTLADANNDNELIERNRAQVGENLAAFGATARQ